MVMAQEYLKNANSSNKGRIVVNMKGFRNDKGAAQVALYASSDGFPGDPNKATVGTLGIIRGKQSEVVFDALPPGKYAVAVLHDDNLSNKMETNLLGIPKKGYGASNNPRFMFRAPKFEETAFVVPEGEKRIDVAINYLI